MKYRLERGGKSYEIDVQPSPEGYLLRGPDGTAQRIALQVRADGSQHAITPWGDMELRSARRGAELWAHVGGRRLEAQVQRARASGAGSARGGAAGELHAPMAGKLLRISVRVGDSCKAGQAVALIEAMKMENELVAPLDGVVVEVCQSAPSTVDKGALIVRLEPR
jgi:biotin carboxyl carrier protein